MKTFVFSLALLSLSVPVYALDDVTAATRAVAPAPVTAEASEVIPPSPAPEAGAASPEGAAVATTPAEPAAPEKAEKKNLFDRVKLSSYAQVRYTHGEGAGTATKAESGFSVRRARLKFELRGGELTSLVIQGDFTPKAVELRDAYVDARDPWTKKAYWLRAGLFKTPYGYEIEQSSSERPVPERSTFTRTVFPGERDLGAGLFAKRGRLRAAAAVMNGDFGDSLFPNRDNNLGKNIVGRVGFQNDFLNVGLSGVGGTNLDNDTGGQFSQKIGNVYLQAEKDFGIGDTFVAGEYNLGITTPTFAGGSDTNLSGWHALVGQNLGAHNQLVYRIDGFNADLENGDWTLRHVVAWNLFLDAKHVRLTTSYQFPTQVAGVSKNDGTFIEQLQFKF